MLRVGRRRCGRVGVARGRSPVAAGTLKGVSFPPGFRLGIAGTLNMATVCGVSHQTENLMKWEKKVKGKEKKVFFLIKKNQKSVKRRESLANERVDREWDRKKDVKSKRKR